MRKQGNDRHQIFRRGADGEDFGAAIKAGSKGRAGFEHIQDIGAPGRAVILQPDAERRRLPGGEEGILLGDGGDVGEEAILVGGARIGGERVDIGLHGGKAIG